MAKVRDIAAALGLRDAAIYYYFPSKQALAYACHVRYLERFERLLEEAGRSGKDGVGKIRLFVHGLLLDRDGIGPQLFFGDHSYLEERERAAIDDWKLRLEQEVEKLLEGGVKDGSMLPCDIRMVAQLILGMLITLHRWVLRTNDPVENQLQAIDAVVFKGLESG